jgi:D-alanyl-D-alanine dipeptidase
MRPTVGVPEQSHTTGARGVSLDVALVRERLQDVGNGFRRLDPKSLPDFANAGLVRILAEKIEQVMVDPPFHGTQLFRHGTPGKTARREAP